MDEEEYDEEEIEVFPSRPLRPIDLVITVASVVHTIFAALTEGSEKIVYLLASHANYRNDQVKFADAARLEIESIPTKE